MAIAAPAPRCSAASPGSPRGPGCRGVKPFRPCRMPAWTLLPPSLSSQHLQRETAKEWRYPRSAQRCKHRIASQPHPKITDPWSAGAGRCCSPGSPTPPPQQRGIAAKMGRFGEFPFHKALSTSPRFVFVRFQNEKTQKRPHAFFRRAQQLQKRQKLEFSFNALKSRFAIFSVSFQHFRLFRIISTTFHDAKCNAEHHTAQLAGCHYMT